MKICAISDIHGNLLTGIQKCDIVCICGDILPLDIQNKDFDAVAWLAGPFQEWALGLECSKVILTWGNHDFVAEKIGKNRTVGIGAYSHDVLFKNDSENKIVVLVDDAFTYEGKMFYGTPWCPNLQSWAFYLPSKQLDLAFSYIPKTVDVLISHCPPKYGSQGIVLQMGSWSFKENFGCSELQRAIERIVESRDQEQKLIVLSGHIHSGMHSWEINNQVQYRNVSILDEDYGLTYEPCYFEL